ncbi:hypothetical protein [Thermococcus sp.]
MKTPVEVKGNKVIFQSPFSHKKYRIIKVLDTNVLVSEVIDYSVSGINIPSKKISRFKNKYGNATVRRCPKNWQGDSDHR